MSLANELITKGWCQDRFQDRDGRVCLDKAIRNCVGLTDDYTYSQELVDRELDVEEILGDTVINWNDAPDRTFDEVLRVAKQCDEQWGW